MVNRKYLSLPVGLVGRALRALSTKPGKGFLANKIAAPLMRGRGVETVVDMTNPGGGKLVCNLDDWIPWNVFIHGNYIMEKNHEKFMLDIARDCEVIFDVGANIGYYTVQFGRLANGQVYSFEPMSYQFNILKKNVELNNLANVATLKSIVTDSVGVKRIYFSSMNNTGMSSLELKSDTYEDVKTIMIDDYCRENEIDAIDLVKIDVEGHELCVLKGMSTLLSGKKVKNIFIEMNNQTLPAAGTSIDSVVGFLDKFGYAGYSIKTTARTAYEGGDESLVYFTHVPD